MTVYTKIPLDPKCKILDIGSGALGMGLFVKSGSVIALDIDDKVRYAYGEKVVASANYLPFKNSSFNVVTAIDMLEHICADERRNVVNEMKRVGATILIHTPIGQQGLQTDIKINNTLRKLFGENSENTMEHIKNGMITEKDLKTFFSNYEFYPTIHSTIQYVVSILYGISPVLAILFSPILKRIHLTDSPYYAGVVCWHQSETNG